MSSNDRKVFFEPQEILSLFYKKGLPENFCIVPFTNMIFNPGGRISVCRHKGTDHFVGDLKNQSIEKIWNNSYMQSWRNEFLTGQVHICEFEQKTNACHLSSSEYHFFDQAKFDVVLEQGILKFTANFNGQCNIQCKMCHIWKMENGFYNDPKFWAEAEEKFFPHIREIELLSGEPFIQKDTYKLIDVVSRINPDCEWSFTTNGFWKFNSYIKEKLKKIRIKNIIISIDSLDPDRYAQIRVNGQLSTVLKTVDDLIGFSEERKSNGQTDLGLTIHYLAMRENLFDVFDILDYCKEKNLRPTLRTLEVPKEHSLLTLPEEDRLLLVSDFIQRADKFHLVTGARVLLPIIKSLSPILQAKGFLAFQDALKSKSQKVSAHNTSHPFN